VTQGAELERAVGEILIDESTLQARIVELGAEISSDYAGRDLLLVGVLKGAVFFMADLMRELQVPCEIDFMAISSYGLDINVAGRDVLVVEDIIDSGLTLSYLMRNLRIPNRFVIGYGLDFAERYRNLPYVAVLHPDLVPNST